MSDSLSTASLRQAAQIRRNAGSAPRRQMKSHPKEFVIHFRGASAHHLPVNEQSERAQFSASGPKRSDRY
jgi:hypothetical protein